ncbi:hypothetical protein QF002_007831 [Paraburkholderia youngii]
MATGEAPIAEMRTTADAAFDVVLSPVACAQRPALDAIRIVDNLFAVGRSEERRSTTIPRNGPPVCRAGMRVFSSSMARFTSPISAARTARRSTASRCGKLPRACAAAMNSALAVNCAIASASSRARASSRAQALLPSLIYCWCRSATIWVCNRSTCWLFRSWSAKRMRSSRATKTVIRTRSITFRGAMRTCF